MEKTSLGYETTIHAKGIESPPKYETIDAVANPGYTASNEAIKPVQSRDVSNNEDETGTRTKHEEALGDEDDFSTKL